MIIFGKTMNDEWIKYPKEKSLQRHVRTSKNFQEFVPAIPCMLNFWQNERRFWQYLPTWFRIMTKIWKERLRKKLPNILK